MVFSFSNIVKFVHIISIIIWLSILFIELVVSRATKIVKNTEKEVGIIKLQGMNIVISLGVGVIVVLSGGYLAGALNANSFLWVILKEIVWMILYVIALFFMRPVWNKLKSSIDNNEDIEIIRGFQKKMSIFTHSMSGLIILNIIFVIFRPL